jgi:hypothetical protein
VDYKVLGRNEDIHSLTDIAADMGRLTRATD